MEILTDISLSSCCFTFQVSLVIIRFSDYLLRTAIILASSQIFSITQLPSNRNQLLLEWNWKLAYSLQLIYSVAIS